MGENIEKSKNKKVKQEQRIWSCFFDPLLYYPSYQNKELLLADLNFYHKGEKPRKTSYKTIGNKLFKVWKKMNFSSINEMSVIRKVRPLIERFDKFWLKWDYFSIFFLQK